MNQYFKIGKFAATFGVHGQLLLVHKFGKRSSILELKTIFLEDKKDFFLPYFISDIKIRKDTEAVIWIEGVDSKEEAGLFLKKEVWVGEDDFKKVSDGSSPVSLLGYVVINDKKELGEIIEVIEQSHQLTCTVLVNGKEALIPIHEGSLKKIDKKNRKVYLSLPEGLLDIYINK